MGAQNLSERHGSAMACLPLRADQVRTEAVAEVLKGPRPSLYGVPGSFRCPGSCNWVLLRRLLLIR